MLQTCILQVGMIGLSHKSTDLPFLELFSRATKAIQGEPARFFSYPFVFLSTCNRTEIYFGAEEPSVAHSELLSFLRLHLEVPFEHRLYSFFGLDCFHHLSRVVAGLDSAIVGECEIQGQVKQAYLQACDRQMLTASLHYVFQKALKIGKMIRNILPTRKLGLIDAVVKMGEEKLDAIEHASILLVGYSKLNRSILSLLKKKGAKQITFATRRPGLVTECQACDREEVLRWREYDWVICAAECDTPLLFCQTGSHTLLFDLGMPRNVDPALKEDHTVTFYDIEEVHQWIRLHEEKIMQGVATFEQRLKIEVARLARIYRKNRLFSSIPA